MSGDGIGQESGDGDEVVKGCVFEQGTSDVVGAGTEVCM